MIGIYIALHLYSICNSISNKFQNVCRMYGFGPGKCVLSNGNGLVPPCCKSQWHIVCSSIHRSGTIIPVVIHHMCMFHVSDATDHVERFF